MARALQSLLLAGILIWTVFVGLTNGLSFSDISGDLSNYGIGLTEVDANTAQLQFSGVSVLVDATDAVLSLKEGETVQIPSLEDFFQDVVDNLDFDLELPQFDKLKLDNLLGDLSKLKMSILETTLAWDFSYVVDVNFDLFEAFFTISNPEIRFSIECPLKIAAPETSSLSCTAKAGLCGSMDFASNSLLICAEQGLDRFDMTFDDEVDPSPAMIAETINFLLENLGDVVLPKALTDALDSWTIDALDIQFDLDLASVFLNKFSLSSSQTISLGAITLNRVALDITATEFPAWTGLTPTGLAYTVTLETEIPNSAGSPVTLFAQVPLGNKDDETDFKFLLDGTLTLPSIHDIIGFILEPAGTSVSSSPVIDWIPDLSLTINNMEFIVNPSWTHLKHLLLDFTVNSLSVFNDLIELSDANFHIEGSLPFNVTDPTKQSTFSMAVEGMLTVGPISNLPFSIEVPEDRAEPLVVEAGMGVGSTMALLDFWSMPGHAATAALKSPLETLSDLLGRIVLEKIVVWAEGDPYSSVALKYLKMSALDPIALIPGVTISAVNLLLQDPTYEYTEESERRREYYFSSDHQLLQLGLLSNWTKPKNQLNKLKSGISYLSSPKSSDAPLYLAPALLETIYKDFGFVSAKYQSLFEENEVREYISGGNQPDITVAHVEKPYVMTNITAESAAAASSPTLRELLSPRASAPVDLEGYLSGTVQIATVPLDIFINLPLSSPEGISISNSEPFTACIADFDVLTDSIFGGGLGDILPDAIANFAINVEEFEMLLNMGTSSNALTYMHFKGGIAQPLCLLPDDWFCLQSIEVDATMQLTSPAGSEYAFSGKLSVAAGFGPSQSIVLPVSLTIPEDTEMPWLMQTEYDYGQGLEITVNDIIDMLQDVDVLGIIPEDFRVSGGIKLTLLKAEFSPKLSVLRNIEAKLIISDVPMPLGLDIPEVRINLAIQNPAKVVDAAAGIYNVEGNVEMDMKIGPVLFTLSLNMLTTDLGYVSYTAQLTSASALGFTFNDVAGVFGLTSLMEILPEEFGEVRLGFESLTMELRKFPRQGLKLLTIDGVMSVENGRLGLLIPLDPTDLDNGITVWIDILELSFHLPANRRFYFAAKTDVWVTGALPALQAELDELRLPTLELSINPMSAGISLDMDLPLLDFNIGDIDFGPIDLNLNFKFWKPSISFWPDFSLSVDLTVSGLDLINNLFPFDLLSIGDINLQLTFSRRYGFKVTFPDLTFPLAILPCKAFEDDEDWWECNIEPICTFNMSKPDFAFDLKKHTFSAAGRLEGIEDCGIPLTWLKDWFSDFPLVSSIPDKLTFESFGNLENSLGMVGIDRDYMPDRLKKYLHSNMPSDFTYAFSVSDTGSMTFKFESLTPNDPFRFAMGSPGGMLSGLELQRIAVSEVCGSPLIQIDGRVDFALQLEVLLLSQFRDVIPIFADVTDIGFSLILSNVTATVQAGIPIPVFWDNMEFQFLSFADLGIGAQCAFPGPDILDVGEVFQFFSFLFKFLSDFDHPRLSPADGELFDGENWFEFTASAYIQIPAWLKSGLGGRRGLGHSTPAGVFWGVEHNATMSDSEESLEKAVPALELKRQQRRAQGKRQLSEGLQFADPFIAVDHIENPDGSAKYHILNFFKFWSMGDLIQATNPALRQVGLDFSFGPFAVSGHAMLSANEELRSNPPGWLPDGAPIVRDSFNGVVQVMFGELDLAVVYIMAYVENLYQNFGGGGHFMVEMNLANVIELTGSGGVEFNLNNLKDPLWVHGDVELNVFGKTVLYGTLEVSLTRWYAAGGFDLDLGFIAIKGDAEVEIDTGPHALVTSSGSVSLFGHAISEGSLRLEHSNTETLAAISMKILGQSLSVEFGRYDTTHFRAAGLLKIDFPLSFKVNLGVTTLTLSGVRFFLDANVDIDTGTQKAEAALSVGFEFMDETFELSFSVDLSMLYNPRDLPKAVLNYCKDHSWDIFRMLVENPAKMAWAVAKGLAVGVYNAAREVLQFGHDILTGNVSVEEVFEAGVAMATQAFDRAEKALAVAENALGAAENKLDELDRDLENKLGILGRSKAVVAVCRAAIRAAKYAMQAASNVIHTARKVISSLSNGIRKLGKKLSNWGRKIKKFFGFRRNLFDTNDKNVQQYSQKYLSSAYAIVDGKFVVSKRERNGEFDPFDKLIDNLELHHFNRTRAVDDLASFGWNDSEEHSDEEALTHFKVFLRASKSAVRREKRHKEQQKRNWESRKRSAEYDYRRASSKYYVQSSLDSVYTSRLRVAQASADIATAKKRNQEVVVQQCYIAAHPVFCESGQYHCDPNAHCVHLSHWHHTQYSCECTPPYEGSGLECEIPIKDVAIKYDSLYVTVNERFPVTATTSQGTRVSYTWSVTSPGRIDDLNSKPFTYFVAPSITPITVKVLMTNRWNQGRSELTFTPEIPIGDLTTTYTSIVESCTPLTFAVEISQGTSPQFSWVFDTFHPLDQRDSKMVTHYFPVYPEDNNPVTSTITVNNHVSSNADNLFFTVKQPKTPFTCAVLEAERRYSTLTGEDLATLAYLAHVHHHAPLAEYSAVRLLSSFTAGLVSADMSYGVKAWDTDAVLWNGGLETTVTSGVGSYEVSIKDFMAGYIARNKTVMLNDQPYPLPAVLSMGAPLLELARMASDKWFQTAADSERFVATCNEVLTIPSLVGAVDGLLFRKQDNLSQIAMPSPGQNSSLSFSQRIRAYFNENDDFPSLEERIADYLSETVAGYSDTFTLDSMQAHLLAFTQDLVKEADRHTPTGLPFLKESVIWASELYAEFVHTLAQDGTVVIADLCAAHGTGVAAAERCGWADTCFECTLHPDCAYCGATHTCVPLAATASCERFEDLRGAACPTQCTHLADPRECTFNSACLWCDSGCVLADEAVAGQECVGSQITPALEEAMDNVPGPELYMGSQYVGCTISTTGSVCSGHGQCVGEDICRCDLGWTGAKCQNAGCVWTVSPTDYKQLVSTHPKDFVLNSGAQQGRNLRFDTIFAETSGNLNGAQISEVQGLLSSPSIQPLPNWLAVGTRWNLPAIGTTVANSLPRCLNNQLNTVLPLHKAFPSKIAEPSQTGLCGKFASPRPNKVCNNLTKEECVEKSSSGCAYNPVNPCTGHIVEGCMGVSTTVLLQTTAGNSITAPTGGKLFTRHFNTYTKVESGIDGDRTTTLWHGGGYAEIVAQQNRVTVSGIIPAVQSNGSAVAENILLGTAQTDFLEVEVKLNGLAVDFEFYSATQYCAKDCQLHMIGDHWCDTACNNVACSYDNGDCLSTTPGFEIAIPDDDSTNAHLLFSLHARSQLNEFFSLIPRETGMTITASTVSPLLLARKLYTDVLAKGVDEMRAIYGPRGGIVVDDVAPMVGVGLWTEENMIAQTMYFLMLYNPVNIHPTVAHPLAYQSVYVQTSTLVNPEMTLYTLQQYKQGGIKPFMAQFDPVDGGSVLELVTFSQYQRSGGESAYRPRGRGVQGNQLTGCLRRGYKDINNDCHCDSGYSGNQCSNSSCSTSGGVSCGSNGYCIDGVCECKRGFGGATCMEMVFCAETCAEAWLIDNECEAQCLAADTCFNDDYDCSRHCPCPAAWLGDGGCDPLCNRESCEYDNGDCADLVECAPGCPLKFVGDRYCDPQCNVEACEFDGGDCPEVKECTCTQEELNDGVCQRKCANAECFYDMMACPIISPSCPESCDITTIGNGVCNDACNLEDCDYDGGDCSTEGQCPEVCTTNSLLGNGVCDSECDSSVCQWDNGDCEADTLSECSPGCLFSMIMDGICQDECNNPQCGFDLTDCLCAAGCLENYRGDGICQPACDNLACNYDDSDCLCAINCSVSMVGDGVCQPECNTPSCNYDGADCVCAPLCQPTMIGDGLCDAACDVAACEYDRYDCGACDDHPDICPEHSICEANAAEGYLHCVPDPGYMLDEETGEYVDIDECALEPVPCSNFSSCVNLVGDYECPCLDHYLGDGKTSCVDENECVEGNFDCPEGTYCQNEQGAPYTCRCNAGYRPLAEGEEGPACVDIDECVEIDSNTGEVYAQCDPHATCYNTIGSYGCRCEIGFQGTGFLCEDSDECATNTHMCARTFDAYEREVMLATCFNTEGNYTCECIDGYTGDGFTCVDLDECATGLFSCPAHSVCVNSVGSYKCQCGNGYSPLLATAVKEELICVDLDECASGDNNCDENAQCSNTDGSYTCECEEGFTDVGSEYVCQDSEGNIYNGIANEMDCSYPESSHYTNIGRVCEDTNECELNATLCPENFTCINTAPGYTCECNDPNGVGCEGWVNPCTTVECPENAECASFGENYVCSCIDGYYEDEVDGKCYDLDECAGDDNDCAENTKCVNLPGSYTCECKDGFTTLGEDCWDTDECYASALCFDAAEFPACVEGINPEESGLFCLYDQQTSALLLEKVTSLLAMCSSLDFANETAIPLEEILCSPMYTAGYVDTLLPYPVYCLDYPSDSGGLAPSNVCPSDSTCINELGSYACICAEGFRTTIIPVDDVCTEVKTAITVEYSESINCSETGALETYECCAELYALNSTEKFCDETFERQEWSVEEICVSGVPPPNSLTCTDIDECAEGISLCHPMATCTNTLGGYECECFPGYTGDGFDCEDIDECALYQDDVETVLCPSYSDCCNTVPLYNCSCDVGFEIDLVSVSETITTLYSLSAEIVTSCVDIDECALYSPCSVDGVCTNLPGSFSCACKEGYSGTGFVCVDIDECAAGTFQCPESAVCQNTEGSYNCVCEEGKKASFGTGVGGTDECVFVDECTDPAYSSTVCTIHAACVNDDPGYNCTCNTGWSRYLFESIDTCTKCNSTVLCSGHGNCKPFRENICACNIGYFGADCSQSCPTSPDPTLWCTHHGLCDWGEEGTGTCACDSGWEGSSCQICIADILCSGHGSCDSENEGACTCDVGWLTSNCEKCDSTLYYCDTTTTCTVSTRYAGECKCLRNGYSGAACDVCHSDVICNSHGTCTGNDAIPCTCSSGWKGTDCSTCDPAVRCYGRADSCNDITFACSACSAGYIGSDCNTCDPAFWCNGHASSCTLSSGSLTSCSCTGAWTGSQCQTPTYTLSGIIRDASTNNGISNALVTLGSSSGYTDSSGRYTISFSSAGTYTLSASMSGYTSYSKSISLSGSVNGGAADMSLSRAIGVGEYRLVLRWNANPNDLDFHVKWDGCHVLYSSRTASCDGGTATLDLDDTSGYGPETITFSPGQASSDAKFYVKWYGGSGTWSTAGASVSLYNRNGLVRTYYAPSSSTTDYWVVTVVRADSDGLYTNYISYNNYQSSEP